MNRTMKDVRNVLIHVPRIPGLSCYRWLIALLKLLSTCLAGVLIGATAAAMHGLINPLITWRNAAVQFFFQRSLAQVGGRGLGWGCRRPMPMQCALDAACVLP